MLKTGKKFNFKEYGLQCSVLQNPRLQYFHAIIPQIKIYQNYMGSTDAEKNHHYTTLIYFKLYKVYVRNYLRLQFFAFPI